ncbi:CocE/NonD family hydrolase [Mycobacterium sp. pV006]|uniref:S15 peptidase family protein n=1 Tax=Mycobacterium sp. pV006 TaxID=3238983 RepID=UPI00351B9A94
MAAGMFVGRVGGLAVALGIGAAVLAGTGAALADDGGGASDTSSGTSQTSDAGPRSSDTTSARQASSEPRAKNRSAIAGAAADQASSGERGTSRSVDTDELDDGDSIEAQLSESVDAETVAASAPESDVVTTEISSVVPADVGDGEEPSEPAQSALALTTLAKARSRADEDVPAEVAAQATTSVAADEYELPTDVSVREVRAPLEWLQEVPVVGRFVVTPIVHLLHAIPFVSEIVHPLIGFPIDHTAAPSTPRARSVKVTSFDGTEIYVHFMPAKGLAAGKSAPTVLNGPGVGLPGATTLNNRLDSFLPYDVVGVGKLRSEGYNVVSWDPRGEWNSGGRMELQSPDFEGRDISHIISWLSTLDSVAKVDGDPRIGMVGVSYGGGVQFSAAIVDRRIDAIVPTVAWNSLVDAIFPRQAVSSVWGTFLSALLTITGARPNERVLPAVIGAVLTGKAKQSDIDLFNSRNHADRLGEITAPTLFMQGTVDTLVPLAQADLNARALIKAGTTTKVVWFCGGHGACLSSRNDGQVVWRETMEWLNRYVKGDETIDTGPQFEWVDQRGDWYSSDTYPVTTGEPVTAVLGRSKRIGYLPLIGASGPNPWVITRGLVPAIMGLPSAAPALNAVNLRVPKATEFTHLIGAPELTLTYSGTGNAKHVYAQLVDNRTKLVLGNQVTPIPVVLDGESRTVTFSMEQIAHTLRPGESLTLQLVTSAFQFVNFYSWGAIQVEGMSLELPTLAGAEVVEVAA